MQLDKLVITLRQRTPWEAMDLGVLLMQKLWPVIFFPWLILMTISLAFVIFAQLQGFVVFAGVFIWWIKPIYESMLLHIISRGLFGEYPSLTDVFSDYKQWFKTGVLSTILFWRISPSRSFNMPVHQLEGLSGASRKQRLNALHRVKGSHSAGITIICMHFEYLLLISLYLVFFFFSPDSISANFNTVIDNPSDQFVWLLLMTIIYALSLFVLEPLYVAAGFMLYLNRRTELEGWDIELDFKKLAQRLTERSEFEPENKVDNHA